MSRLIDADALHPDVRLKDGTLCFSKSRIANAPTIEERPKGKWITRNGGIVFPFWERYECSVCHEYNGCSNYCPNCGADMRGDV